MRYVVAAILALGVGSAGAATWTVNKTTDTADGTCDQDCSLREAVIAANQTEGADEIVLPAGTFQLTRDSGDGVPFGTLDIDDPNTTIPDDLTIRGAGMASTIVEQTVFPEAAGVFRVLDGGQFVLRDMTVRGGHGVDGACLHTSVPTAVDRVTFSECRADDDGGALMNFAPLVVRESVFDQNFASDDGGALMTFALATISDTTFSDNGALDDGGAIMPFDPLVLERVTLSGNRAGNSGGAIMNFTPVTATNCTFSDNQAGFAFPAIAGLAPSGSPAATGGAIHAFEPLRLVHSTLTANAAPGGGGGILNAYVASSDPNAAASDPTAVELQATIVAANTPDDCRDEPSSIPPVTAIVSLGHVLDSDGTCVRGATGDQTAADPGLAALADNGGPAEPHTLTHALEPDSPALDAAGDACAAATDQRGVARPMDGDEDGSVLCDVGAFEVGGTTTTTTPGSSTTTTTLPGCDGAGRFAAVLCDLDALIAATGASQDLGRQQPKLARAAGAARPLVVRGRDKCAAGDAKAEKKSGRDLRTAGRKLNGYKRGLTSNKARKVITDEAVRATFLGMLEPLVADVKALKRSVACPEDTSPNVALEPRR